MKKYLLFLCLAAAVFACGDSPAEKKTGKKTKKVAQVDGAKIYKNYCVICHGTQGDMGSNGAFNLQTSSLNVEERIMVIKKGRGVMTPFDGVLKEDEIKAVADYTMTLTK